MKFYMNANIVKTQFCFFWWCMTSKVIQGSYKVVFYLKMHFFFDILFVWNLFLSKGAVPKCIFKARFAPNPLPTVQFCWNFFCELVFGQIKNFWKKNCGFFPLSVISRQIFKTAIKPSFLKENGWIFLSRQLLTISIEKYFSHFPGFLV